MDNVLIMDKLDDLSARFDDKIGQIETKLDGLGQDIVNVSYDTELLAGQQKYILVPLEVDSSTPYYTDNSIYGVNYVVNGSNDYKYYDIYKFSSTLDGTITVYLEGRTNQNTSFAVTNLFIKNTTSNEYLYTSLLAASENDNYEWIRTKQVPIIANNNYSIGLYHNSGSRNQRTNFSNFSIYATTNLIIKTISNQIVKIN